MKEADSRNDKGESARTQALSTVLCRPAHIDLLNLLLSDRKVEVSQSSPPSCPCMGAGRGSQWPPSPRHIPLTNLQANPRERD